MSQEILFKQVQWQAMQLPPQYEAGDGPLEAMPYTLGQAAEVREYAVRRRDQLLDQGGSVKNDNVDAVADFVQSAIVTLEDQMLSDMTPDEAWPLVAELRAKEEGFMNAGRDDERGLLPPKSYRRIGAVAAGFAANIQKNQMRSLAS